MTQVNLTMPCETGDMVYLVKENTLIGNEAEIVDYSIYYGSVEFIHVRSMKTNRYIEELSKAIHISIMPVDDRGCCGSNTVSVHHYGKTPEDLMKVPVFETRKEAEDYVKNLDGVIRE